MEMFEYQAITKKFYIFRDRHQDVFYKIATMKCFCKIYSKTSVSMQACIFTAKGLLEDCLLMDSRKKIHNSFFAKPL